MSEKNKPEILGKWSNVEVAKWCNGDNISYSIKLSYKQNDNWEHKNITLFPNEVLNLKKAVELIERNLW